jgi:transcriptional/translational regulatory protein YebC/TACO1
MEVAVGAGAEDYADDGEVWTVTTPPDVLSVVLEALEAAKIAVKASQLGFIPKNKKAVTGRDAELCLKNVYADFDVSDEEMARLS